MWATVFSALSAAAALATLLFLAWDRFWPRADLLNTAIEWAAESEQPELFTLIVEPPPMGSAILEQVSVSSRLEISGYTTDRGPKGNLLLRTAKGYGPRLAMQRQLTAFQGRPLRFGIFLRVKEPRARSSASEHQLTLHVLITSPRRRRRRQTINVRLAN